MSTANSKEIISQLLKIKNKTRAIDVARFFKTGPGEYGEGDRFLGLTVPQIRKIAGDHKSADINTIEALLQSEFHEIRFCGLVILTNQFKKSKSLDEKKIIYNFYIRQIKEGAVNNWDLIDVPGSTIGEYLLDTDNPLDTLIKFAKSKNLWIRRSAVIFTFPFIRIGDVKPTLKICELLIDDDHDLIHKATGWALREAGKRNISALRGFLNEYSEVMPRTMLRYAIEKLPERERKGWLRGSSSASF